MAKEILVIDKSLVIFFAIYTPAPIVIGGEGQVLREPSSALPPIAADFLTTNEPNAIPAIDNGIVSWQPMAVEIGPTETVLELVVRTKKKWVLWKAAEDKRIARWANQIANVRWLHVG